MAPRKFLSLYFILFLSLSLPFSHSSPTLLENPKAVAVNTPYSTVMQGSGGVAGKGKGKGLASLSAAMVEDSARQVPTGPDPLHHNDNPTAA